MSADPAAAPSGVVTFLFTDVEGSTRRWESDARAMRAALVVHDKVLRTAIEGYDGFLFSHTGDGCVAAFASPMSAVSAAIDAQRELQLPVRMGLATGEAELRDGDAALFDRLVLGRLEPAATIAGFALSPLAATALPEINTAIAHLREVLGEATYESLARKGETMTTAEMVTYAYDQIDQARATLEHPS